MTGAIKWDGLWMDGDPQVFLMEPGDRDLFYIPSEDQTRHCPKPTN